MSIPYDELKGIVKEILGSSLEEILAPIKEQQTKWMNEILSARTSQVEEKGKVVGGIIRALAATKGNYRDALDWATKAYGGANSSVVKALEAGTPSAGGYIVFPEYSAEVIELLRPKAVVRRMGAQTIPMPAGTLRIPALTGGSTASYIGENANIGQTAPAFGQITLSWKKLAALVPVSNDLLRFSSISADKIVRDDLVRAMAAREDLAFIRDDGTGDKPKGILNWVAAGNKFNAQASPDLTKVTQDLTKAVYLVMNSDVDLAGCAWIFAPRTWKYLWGLLNSNGVPVFRDELNAGKLWGFPVATTTQIPVNLGTGSDSEVYFVNFTDCIIGEAETLTIDASNVAAYYDGSAIQAAFSRDQTVIRTIAEHDFALRYTLAGSVIQQVTWGA